VTDERPRRSRSSTTTSSSSARADFENSTSVFTTSVSMPPRIIAANPPSRVVFRRM
jgi:hypothetical protein